MSGVSGLSGVGDDRALREVQQIFLVKRRAGRVGLRIPKEEQKKSHLKVALEVEPEGFEPSSKQAITMLSTCLAIVWVVELPKVNSPPAGNRIC